MHLQTNRIRANKCFFEAVTCKLTNGHKYDIMIYEKIYGRLQNMKRFISNIVLFFLSITLFSYVYIGMFKMSAVAVCILFAFFCAYGVCMGASWKSMEELKKCEQKLIHFGLENKDCNKILCFSLTTLLPTYFCVFLVSLIPLYTYEVWFVTVFPCMFLNILPANSVWKEYFELTNKRAPFLLLFLLIVILCCGSGIIISNLFFK